MKTSTLASLLLLSVAGLASIRKTTAQCYDYTDALDISARTPISCNIVNKVKEPTPQPANFIINYKCEIETNQELCTKAQQSIQKVGEILTSNLNLITNINVDVTLRNLCPTDAEQPCDELGGAEFARTMELLDDDNVIREYPTTLVKQFDCEQHYEFGDVDIRAVFNGGNATSLWFEGDPQINPDQKDFRAIVLREFINALGVQTSFIEQSIFSNLTPKVLTPQLTLAKGNDGVLEFKGFREYAFDKYIIIRGKEVQSINEFAKSFNDFAKEPDNKFKDEEDFIAKFVQSSQIGVAQNVANISVTQSTLGFQPRGAKSVDDAIVLETSLNPYQNGVSINSFDASIYATTEEFLMVSPVISGKTLEDSMGNSQSPLGPKLISLLETLGYPTKQLPENNFKVCNIPPTSPPSPAPPPAPSPAPAPSPTVTTTAITTSITTQITTTIPVVVTTTVQQGSTSVVETETQHVVTKIESVSQSVVTTVKVVDAYPTEQTLPTNDPNDPNDPNDGDFFGGGSLNIQNNFSLMFFVISLISCLISIL